MGGMLIRGTPSSIPSTYNASYYMGSLTPGASGRTLIDAAACLGSPHPVNTGERREGHGLCAHARAISVRIRSPGQEIEGSRMRLLVIPIDLQRPNV